MKASVLSTDTHLQSEEHVNVLPKGDNSIVENRNINAVCGQELKQNMNP